MRPIDSLGGKESRRLSVKQVSLRTKMASFRHSRSVMKRAGTRHRRHSVIHL